MRRIHLILAAALALMLSCGSNKNEPVGGETTPLSVTPLMLRAEALGGQFTLTVTSSTDWLVRSSAAWLKALTPKGTPSDTQIRLSADENKGESLREAVVTVSNLSGESKQITVTQAKTTGEVIEYGISSVQDLVGLSKAVRGEGSIARYLVDGVIRFNKDIDASSITEWIPIGDADYPLTYSIDGNNKIISGIHWSVDATKYPDAGFIGLGKGITVSRLTFGNSGSSVNFKVSGSEAVRAGGIIGQAQGVTLQKVTSNAALSLSGSSTAGEQLLLGGIAGLADASTLIGGEVSTTHGCRSLGNLTSTIAARVGGIAGSNAGTIQGCTFQATVSAPREGNCGPAWLCAYGAPAAKDKVTGNNGYGYVGSTPSCMKNAMLNVEEAYDPEANTVDWTLDAYYDWTEVETKQLHSGAVYHHYSCTNVPREIYAVEVDLTDPGIELTAAFAGEIVPNPNGNGNSNNGKKIRELLSELCVRRRAEGQNILAGVNASFFNSHDGFTRGFHVEECQPVYINNPDVVKLLPNHAWGFTVFKDRTASCGKKSFSGKIRFGDQEFRYYSLNDTILRHRSAEYEANLFNSRYVRQPYPDHPELLNGLAGDVLYVTCEYTGTPMEVNAGWAQARVVDIRDGRSDAIEPPYISASNRVGLALSGATATAWKSGVKAGDSVQLRCDISVDGVSKPIYMQVSTMYQLMTAGEDVTSTVGASSVLHTKFDPTSFPVVSKDMKKVWIVEVDGRQLWYSLGVKAYEMYRIAKKLGGWWMTRFDGGGSAAMWLWDSAAGKGGLVSRPSDKLGERSCMNYLLIRAVD